MPNIFDQFDAAFEVKDLVTSFGVGSNQLLKTVGDVYGLATGDMDNVVSRQGRENIDYLQRGKSEKLRQAEARRKAAVDAEEGTLNQALKYAKETFTDPRLLLSGTAEAVPSLVGAGGIGAGARVAAGRVLGKKGAETAAKIGVGSAVAAGSGQQGTSVGAEQYSEVADILKKMPDEQAMEVPEIARLMIENGYSLEKAKTALTLNLARSTGALAAIASAVTQMVPGGRTIESALVGGAGRKVAGGTLARRGIGAAIGGLGESLQEGAEEGSGAGLKNLLARAVEPEREITKGVGEAMGAGFSNAALLGAAAGAASRPSRPVPVGETTAGKSGEPQASDATSDIPVLESTTEQPSISLRDIENMSPEEFAAAIDVRDAASRGGKPRPEDVTSLENVRPGPVQESDTTIAPVQEALDEWRNQNPDVGLSVTVVNDPNLRNTRNYGIRGYFDPNTGEVVINSAFTKPFEVESVVNHEWSHHTLASDEGRAALAEFATRDIPATELSDLAKRYPNADNLTLVEEWIARNQEKSPGVFARIVAKIREWLNGKLGINMTNEEAARVMLRTLRERGAPIAEEGSAEMRQSTTDQPVGESEPVKREPGRSGMMASPSVVDINYDRAKRNLTSSDQARFRSDVEGFAPEATVYNAVGDWADGAENSVAAVFKDVRSSEELRQLAASAGLTGDQKAALWWRVEENGPDAIHQVTWPKGITMDEARQAMIDAGLENRTLIQTRDGVMGFVFDQGQQNLSKIDKLYESSTNPSTHSSPATGEFVGSWGTRIEGKRAYRNVLGLPTKTPEGEGVSGLGVRGRGEPETGAEAGPATGGGGGVLSSPGRMDAGTGSKTSSRQPNETVRKLADEYNVQSGQDPIEHGHYVPVNESLAQRIAKAYDALPEIDRSPETIRAYETLAKEVGDQWDFAVNNLGITFEPWTKEGQPYANSREMVKDVRDNNHLYFFQGGDPHPFLNEVDPQTGFTANDKLRAVHDLFGHAAEDYQFGPRGEENAWIKHSQMFSPEAQRALSSETRGQNSWVNFGAQNYENGVNKNIPAKDRPFAVQKTALLPEELTDWRAALGKSESEFESESEPERASVLAKQPIRESVTDEPVGQTKKQTESPEFKKWFGNSKVVDKQGKPLVMYHGTKADFTEFKSRFPDDDNLIFFTRNPEFASKWAQDRQAVGRNFTEADFESAKADEKAWWKSEVNVSPVGDLLRKDGTPLTEDEQTEFWTETRKRSAVAMQDSADASVYPVFLKAEKIFDPSIDGKKLESFLKTLPNMQGAVERGMHMDGSWAVYENKPVTDWLRSRGYDAVRLRESSAEIGGKMDTLAVFSPTQIKSATGNRGTFDPTNPDIRFSVTDEPVERVPEEGDPDYEEIEDTESALGAAANVRERDDLSPTSALNTLYAKKSAVPVPTTGKRTNGQVAEQLRQAAIAYWGKELSSSNLTEEDIARLVDNGVEEVLAGLKASNHAGNWYTTAIRKAMAIAGVLHPELTDDALAQKAGFKDAHAAEVGLAAAMAITSQNLNVEKNTAYANDQFNILKKTGRFDPSKVYGSKAEAISGNLELANVLLDKVGWDGMEGFLNREYTLKELNDVASQLLGQKISITGKVDDVVNGSAIFGPKIGGGFFQNLRGNFNPVTVDLWMRRTWGRWTGNVLPDPLDAKRLARMIDGMRESGIQLPEELRSIRTITAKKGRKVPTLSDATAERVLSDPQAVTAAYDFAALHEARWNKIYGEVRQNITPEQAEAIRNGSLSLEELNRQQQKSLRQKRDAWQDLEDRPSISTKEGRAAQKELFATMDAEAGRTAILTNEELSDNKPEWAKSARVIKTLLKPIDVPSDIDRRAIVDVVNRIRNELDRQGVSATNADIQAILWYPEKDLWAKLAGKKESNLKNSYDEEFLRVAESQGLGNEARSASAKVGD